VNFQHQMHSNLALLSIHETSVIKINTSTESTICREFPRLPGPHLHDNAKTRWKCLALPENCWVWPKEARWLHMKWRRMAYFSNHLIFLEFRGGGNTRSHHFFHVFPDSWKSRIAKKPTSEVFSNLTKRERSCPFFLSRVVDYESQNLKNAWKNNDRVVSNYEFPLVGFQTRLCWDPFSRVAHKIKSRQEVQWPCPTTSTKEEELRPQHTCSGRNSPSISHRIKW